MLTNEEIILAYRLMLGRDPESPDVVNNLRLTVHTVSALREEFQKSAEFRQRMGAILEKPQHVRHRHSFTMPKIPVEVKVDPEQLGEMFDRIHMEWEHLGETDPYWSVMTQPQFHIDQFVQHREAFYASGKYAHDIFLAALRRNDVNPHHLQSCLEVGCGVGRVTPFLAGSFERVLAADISAHHLALARTYLAEAGINNVDLQHWDRVHCLETLPPLDAIFSVLTLQHNPPPVMAWMVHQLLAALKPGGVAFLQIPTYRNGYLFEVERYLHTPPTKALEMHFLPQREVFRLIGEAGCVCLEMREDGMVGDEEKMLSNSFVIQKI